MEHNYKQFMHEYIEENKEPLLAYFIDNDVKITPMENSVKVEYTIVKMIYDMKKDFLNSMFDALKKNFSDVRFEIVHSFASKETMQAAILPVKHTISNKVTGINNRSLRFDNFLTDISNQMAWDVFNEMRTNLPSFNHNVIYIYGSPGVGKTHLVTALGNYLIDNEINDISYYFIIGADFINESMDTKNLQNFINRCTTCDIFVLDDVQACFRTKSKFPATILRQVLYERLNDKKLTLFTSDRDATEIKHEIKLNPEESKSLDDSDDAIIVREGNKYFIKPHQRLVSRMKSQLTIYIKEPDNTAKYRFFFSKIYSELGRNITEKEEYYIRQYMTILPNDFRYIEGVAITVQSKMKHGTELQDIILASLNERGVLVKTMDPANRYNLMITNIATTYSLRMGYDYDMLFKQKKLLNKDIRTVRDNIIIALVYKHRFSYREIAASFGRTSSVVASAVKNYESKNQDDLWSDNWQEISQKINSIDYTGYEEQPIR